MKKEESAKLFSRNMRKLRKEYGYTLESFGQLVGVTASSASRWETSGANFRFPNPEFIDKICSVYRIPISDLFAADGAEKATLRVNASLQDALHIVNKHLRDGEFKLVPYPKT